MMAGPMSRKRDILEVLTRDDLLKLVDAQGLLVADRRRKSDLVEALASSKKAKLDELLATLSRDTLKAGCRALDVSDGGKEKAVLLERILGGGDRPGSPARAKAAAPMGAVSSRASEESHPPAPLAYPTSSKRGAAGLERPASVRRGTVGVEHAEVEE